MTKATHNGHCQACGRLQAVTARGIAKHGYTKQWGWFQGTCAGSGRPALEEYKGYAEMIVKQLSEQAVALHQLTADDVTHVTVYDRERRYGAIKSIARKVDHNEIKERLVRKFTDDNGRFERVFKTPADFERHLAYEWNGKVESELRQAHNQARQMDSFITQHCNLIERVHGQELPERSQR